MQYNDSLSLLSDGYFAISQLIKDLRSKLVDVLLSCKLWHNN